MELLDELRNKERKKSILECDKDCFILKLIEDKKKVKKGRKKKKTKGRKMGKKLKSGKGVQNSDVELMKKNEKNLEIKNSVGGMKDPYDVVKLADLMKKEKREERERELFARMKEEERLKRNLRIMQILQQPQPTDIKFEESLNELKHSLKDNLRTLTQEQKRMRTSPPFYTRMLKEEAKSLVNKQSFRKERSMRPGEVHSRILNFSSISYESSSPQSDQKVVNSNRKVQWSD